MYEAFKTVLKSVQYVLNIGATGNYILGAYGGTVSCGSVEGA